MQLERPLPHRRGEKAVIESTLKLSVNPNGVPLIIAVSQYDVGSRKIIFEMTGGYTVPNDAVVHLRGTKPDGTGFDYVCDVSDGNPSIVVQEQMTACPGNVVCELAIYENDTKLHTERFIICVRASALSNNVKLSESQISTLEKVSSTDFASVALSGNYNDLINKPDVATQSENGLLSAADKRSIDREFMRLAPTNATILQKKSDGTRADLTDDEYLKVGHYCKTSAMEIVDSSPTQNPFIMYVFSPSSTYDDETMHTSDVMRMRVIIDFGGTIYTQSVYISSSGSKTFRNWKTITTNDLLNNFVGATASANGSNGLVPRPTKADVKKYLCGDGTWKAVSGDNPVQISLTKCYVIGSNGPVGVASVGNTTAYRIGHSLIITAMNGLAVYAYGQKSYVHPDIFTIQKIEGVEFVDSGTSFNAQNSSGYINAVRQDDGSLRLTLYSGLVLDYFPNVCFQLIVPLLDE